MDENKELVETMEDYAEELEASFKRLHEDDIVTGTVVAVTDDQVLVDLKYFAQGVIDRRRRAGLRAVRPARSWKERSRQLSHTARLSCWKMA